MEQEHPVFTVLPDHLGIIMDGNGRWAQQRGYPRSAGHQKGANTFRTIVDYCADLKLKYVTFYCFSSENWKRPREEVQAIMNLFREYLVEADERQTESKNSRVHFIGDRSGIAEDILELMDQAEEDTKNNTGTVVNLAINYGGRQEIIHACQVLAQEVAQGLRAPESIDEASLEQHLYTAGQADPDLIIRPSGEQRLSNFLLWQAAYSEFWYSDVLWPDFTTRDLDQALLAYEHRNRRFGA